VEPTEYTEHFQECLTESLDIIRSFLSQIEAHKDQLRTGTVLPLNALFEEACRLEKSMSKDKQLKNDECEKMRIDIERLFLQM
jgi:hypothetical protein